MDDLDDDLLEAVGFKEGLEEDFAFPKKDAAPPVFFPFNFFNGRLGKEEEEDVTCAVLTGST